MHRERRAIQALIVRATRHASKIVPQTLTVIIPTAIHKRTHPLFIVDGDFHSRIAQFLKAVFLSWPENKSLEPKLRELQQYLF